MFDISVPGGRLNKSVSRAEVIFGLELLLTATVTGGIAGWLIGGTRTAVFSTTLAGFFFALGPGYNIPFLAGPSGHSKASWSFW